MKWLLTIAGVAFMAVVVFAAWAVMQRDAAEGGCADAGGVAVKSWYGPMGVCRSGRADPGRGVAAMSERTEDPPPDELGVVETVDGSAYVLWSRTGRTVSVVLTPKATVPDEEWRP